MADNRVHLPVLRVGIRYITCPYQERRQVPSESCFINQRNATHEFCFRCPDGAQFEAKYKGLTYTRYVTPGISNPPIKELVMVRMPVSRKKHGVDYTYVRFHLATGKVEMPFYETMVSGTILSSKEHFSPVSEAELAYNERRAAAERRNMVRGKGGAKVGISPEMQAMIDDKKKRDKADVRGWYARIPVTGSASTPRRTVITHTNQPRLSAVPTIKAKKKEGFKSTSDLISSAASKLFSGFSVAGKKK